MAGVIQGLSEGWNFTTLGGIYSQLRAQDVM